MHLGFEVAQIQFDVPAHGVEPGELQRRIEFGLREGREQKEAPGAEAVALEFDDEQAAGDGIGAEIGLELVLAGPCRSACRPGRASRRARRKAAVGGKRQAVRAGSGREERRFFEGKELALL